MESVRYNENVGFDSVGGRDVPLLDHFHPPLLGQRHWEGFHGWWAAALAGHLNEDLLPPEYFAEFQVTLGTQVEVDVGAFTENELLEQPERNGGGTAVETLIWAPPAPAAVAGAVF